MAKFELKYQPSGEGDTRSLPAKSKMAARGPQNDQHGRFFVTEKERKVEEEEVEKNSQNSGPLSSCQLTARKATDWNADRLYQF